tara:strand:+ start:9509 stop:10495 length:987 start_codon:yes stop_codon:yes gene_type:complete
MATVFKTLLTNDIAMTRTLLNEAIPLTGTIVSGTYNDLNIKKDYIHGMFESVYDYPYMSSSANHIFDITYGYSSALSGAGADNSKKLNIYNQMAQVLVGYDQTGSIRKFDSDGDYLGASGAASGTMDACVFLSYSRLLIKDEIKKQSYSITINSASSPITISDYGANTEYRVNSPAGEYGLLYTSSVAPYGTSVGLIFYQAGMVVLTGSAAIFDSYLDFTSALSITGTADNVRSNWSNNDFQNTTELNSTIYFCRAANNEYNYSSNQTYLSESQIIVKNNNVDQPPVTYITTIGLYSPNNELLAVAKLSEPLKKDPATELIFRVRLDY